MSELKRTPLHDLHRELGARLVPFAGWEMPVQYPAGILAEHQHGRAAAALFDVSHMGQVRLDGADAAIALERLVPADIQGLKPGRARYTQFTDGQGGILDDLIVSNAGDHLFLVVNAGCRDADLDHLRGALEPAVRVTELADRALLALQGPAAATVLARLAPPAAELPFMGTAEMDLSGVPCRVSRLGYTGEDGYEISVPAADAMPLARTLLAQPEVKPAGLGARDSLRLEAGLPLYGHDLDETTDPVEGNASFAISKRRREEGGFPGAGRILKALAEGPGRKLVGLTVDGKLPVREGAPLFAGATQVGRVTSGGFAPSVSAPIAMGYVAAPHFAVDTPLEAEVRGKRVPVRVAAMPFVPHQYVRKGG